MEKLKYKSSIVCVTILFGAICLVAGCGYEGFGSLLGTESYHEQIMPAEYDLGKQFEKPKQKDKAQQAEKKLLVLVEQPAWLSTQTDLRYYLTKAIRTNIMVRVELKPENLISYDKLVDFRASQSDFSSLSPVEIGKAMDANMVLLVLIENYQLKEMADTGYLTGNLDTRGVLYDVQTGEKLWPAQEASKSIKVGFEVETGGAEVAIARLAAANAFCTTRYLYDCQKARFNVAEDRTSVGWENWK